MKRFTKPLILTLSSLLIVCTAGFAFVALNNPIETGQSPVATVVKPNPPTVSQLFKLINEEREKAGVKPLILDPRLNGSAQQKADDMYKNNYDSHVDANGRHGYDIAHEYAPDICKKPSENLYWGDSAVYPSSSKDAVKWWMSSKAHHDALLSSTYIYTGFGVSGAKVVEHFC